MYFLYLNVHHAFYCSIVILFTFYLNSYLSLFSSLLDWNVLQKNAMIGGAVTGALVSAVSSNKKDKIAIDAITGAAIATAAEFINYLT